MFFVERFSLLQLEAQSLAFLPGGVYTLDGPEAVQYLQALQPYNGRMLSAATLHNLLKTQGLADIPDAWLQTGLVRTVDPLPDCIESVLFVSPEPQRMAALADWAAHTFPFEVRTADLASAQNQPADCCLLYAQPYEHAQLRRFFESDWALSAKVIQTCYRLDRFLYLDNPYIPSMSTPNHLSVLNQLRTKANAANEEQYDYFCIFADVLELDQLPAIELNAFEEGFVDFQIMRRLQQLLGTAFERMRVDSFHTATAIDLLTTRSYESIITHYDTAALSAL